MNKIIYIFFVLLSQNATCQVLKFNDLIRMTFDLNTFEKINLSMGNQMVNQQKKTFYSYQTETGEIGSSVELPTNDKKYEAIFLFENGNEYRESEIDSLNLDPEFEIRSNLIPINNENINGFYFINSKLTELFKTELIMSEFSENYTPNTKTASTWYVWESLSKNKIISNSNSPNSIIKKLEIQFNSEDDYRSVLNQILDYSKYIETKKIDEKYVSYYEFENCKITSEKFKDSIRNGGIITVKIEE